MFSTSFHHIYGNRVNEHNNEKTVKTCVSREEKNGTIEQRNAIRDGNGKKKKKKKKKKSVRNLPMQIILSSSVRQFYKPRANSSQKKKSKKKKNKEQRTKREKEKGEKAN